MRNLFEISLRNPFGLVLALTILTTTTFGQLQTAAPGALSQVRVEKIDAAVRAWMNEKKAPGLSVAIVQDNKVVFRKGYGLADLENKVAASPDTAYRLASITKTMTAIGVMQLVERGKVDLDAPANKYCAAYPAEQTLASAPDKKFSITVRQLLVHHSGIRHNKMDEILTTKHYNSINEAIASFKDDALVAEPESRYAYSTPGYTLLGCVIEGASGVSYFDYLRENVLKPSGMMRTFVDDIYAIIANRAKGYQKTQAGEIRNAPLHDTSIKIPGGGLVTTVDDLASLAVAINTDKLVKPETSAKMWTKPKAKDGKEQSYAMGVLVGGEGENIQVFNDGGQAGTRSYLFMMPRRKFAIAIITNLQNAFCEELLPAFNAILSEK